MSIQPLNQNNIAPNSFASEMDKQMNLANFSFQNNTQNNDIASKTNNINQSLSLLQNQLNGQMNSKMPIDNMSFGQNLLPGFPGVGNNDPLNNVSPDKQFGSVIDSYRNTGLFPSQMDRKAFMGMPTIENRLSDFPYDQTFDLGFNMKSTMDDPMSITMPIRNSQIQNSYLFSNNYFSSSRNQTGLFNDRYPSGVGVPLNSINIADDSNKLFLQGNQQTIPQSYRLNAGFGFCNPNYVQNQAVTKSQIQSTAGEPLMLEQTSTGSQANSANAKSIEEANFQKLMEEQLEQTNRNPCEPVEQFIRSSTNQVAYPSQISVNQAYYNYNTAPNAQGIQQSQLRFASGYSTANSSIPMMSVVPSAGNGVVNIFNPSVKSGFQTTELNNILKKNQILLSSGSALIDAGAMNFGNSSQQQQNLLKYQIQSQQKTQTYSITNQAKEFEMAIMNSLKTETPGDNEGNDSDKTEKNPLNRNDEIGKKNLLTGGKGYPMLERDAAFITKKEGDQENNIFGSIINPFEENNDNSMLKNRGLNMFDQNDKNSLLIKKDNINGFNGLSGIGNALNLQNNRLFNGLSNNKYANAKNRLENINRQNDNSISFPNFDYNQQDMDDNLIQNCDQNRQNPSSMRNSFMNADSMLQDDDEKNLRKNEKTISCNCQKSQCLKLYCDCFQKGVMCNDTCRCTQCKNNYQHMSEREKAVQDIQTRNPQGFQQKNETEAQVQASAQSKKGCNCKNSGCKKKYCVCFNAGVKCSYQCRCGDCKNGKHDGPDQQGEHINIDGPNIALTQENFNNLNMLSINTPNNSYGNIKLNIFNPQQEQMQIKIERNSENNNINQDSQDNEQDQNMIQTINEQNENKLTHQRYELEDNFTQRKKQKKEEDDIFGGMNQQQQTFDLVFNNNNPNQQNNQNETEDRNKSNSNNHIKNEQSNLTNNNRNTDTDNLNTTLQQQQQQILEQQKQLELQSQLIEQFKLQFQQQEQQKQMQQNYRNHSFSNQNQNPKENGFSNQQDQNNDRNIQFNNLRRANNDNTNFIAN